MTENVTASGQDRDCVSIFPDGINGEITNSRAASNHPIGRIGTIGISWNARQHLSESVSDACFLALQMSVALLFCDAVLFDEPPLYRGNGFATDGADDGLVFLEEHSRLHFDLARELKLDRGAM